MLHSSRADSQNSEIEQELVFGQEVLQLLEPAVTSGSIRAERRVGTDGRSVAVELPNASSRCLRDPQHGRRRERR